MNKEIIICVIIILIIAIGNYETQNYTKNAVEEVIQELQELEEDIENIKKDENIQKIERIELSWKEKQKNLAYFIEHTELEKVENCLIDLDSWIRKEKYIEAVIQINKSMFLLKHIEDKYDVNLQNIF